MKRITSILIVALFIGCSGSGIYNATITDYLVAAKQGNDIKVIEVRELERVTVADSIQMLNEHFTALRDGLADQMRNAIGKAKSNYEAELEGGHQVMQKFYEDLMTDEQHRLDSLMRVPLPGENQYAGRDKAEELGIIVRAKYTFTNPRNKQTSAAERDFLLTPDGKKCLGVRDPVKE